ncbi:MAG: secretin N-terminal domain-containing protein, partial [Planctomycetota bacterium]
VSESLAGGSLLGPVQIEFIEGLDIIVVRGNDEDVQRVLEIINQIETLSEVTVPEIQVYQLKHVDSVSMGRLLQRVYADVLGPRTGSVSITPLGKPDALLLVGRTENVRTAAELINQLDQPVSPTARLRAFRLKFANAEEAAELITTYFDVDDDVSDEELDNVGAFAGRPLVVADTRSNTLIARAAPRDMLEIAELVTRIDRPADAEAELKVFTVKNGDAQALAEMLASLFGTDEDGDEPGGLGASSSALSPLQITFDQRTNSVIAAGSVEDLAIVEAVLLRLDQDGLRQRETQVFRLNNAFAPEVADALNQLLEDQRDAEEAADLTISPFEQIDREIIIVAEQATNSLIISANPEELPRIERLVQDLDARPPMVMIQVLIAEVRLNDTDEFGLELGLQDSLLFDRSLVGELQTVTTTTQDQSPGGAILTTTEQTIINAPLTPGFNFNNVLEPTGNNGSTSALATAGAVAAQG